MFSLASAKVRTYSFFILFKRLEHTDITCGRFKMFDSLVFLLLISNTRIPFTCNEHTTYLLLLYVSVINILLIYEPDDVWDVAWGHKSKCWYWRRTGWKYNSGGKGGVCCYSEVTSGLISSHTKCRTRT